MTVERCLHNSGAGMGEDVLEAALTVRNTSDHPQCTEVEFATSVRIENQYVYVPLSYGDSRFAALGSKNFFKDGSNELEIRITNLWVNRLIGDAKKMAPLGVTFVNRGVIKGWPAWVMQDAPPADAPVSFATWRQWDGTEPLEPSGLIGPVTLRAVKTLTVK